MATPGMVLASVIKLMVVSMGVFWIVSFFISRVHVFYEAYTAFLHVLQQEAWLRKQCAIPEFFSNMRQHADVCEQAQRNSERSPFLIALNAVAETGHVCGHRSCADALSGAGWPAILALGVTVAIAPTLLVRIARCLVVGDQLPRHYDSVNLKHV